VIFISYYTVGVYEEVMKKYLLPSLQKWNLKYDIAETEDLGNWQANTGFKCKFIKEMLLKYKKDICFLDADATIESYPDLLFKIPEEYDIAIHLLDWMLFWRNNAGQEQRELLSGTMIVKYNEKAFKLLDEWIKQVEIQKTVKEQKVLEKIVLNNPKYNMYDLPPAYCAIKKFDGSIPEYVGKPIILHHQMSRLYRNKKK
jgi:hypothetical protein